MIFVKKIKFEIKYLQIQNNNNLAMFYFYK